MARLDDLNFGQLVWVKDRAVTREQKPWVPGIVTGFGNADWVTVRTEHWTDAFRCGEIKLVEP